MRNPLRLNTLQGTTVIMMAWFGLLFVGVDGLVTPIRPEHGFWFGVATFLWLNLFAIYFADLFRRRWVKFHAIALGLFWGFLQFSHHLRGLFFKDDPAVVARYYENYDTFYLIGPFEDRVFPDLYLILLDLMIIALIWIGIKRVLMRAYY